MLSLDQHSKKYITCRYTGDLVGGKFPVEAKPYQRGEEDTGSQPQDRGGPGEVFSSSWC